ncbi:RNA-processing protein [Candidatus Woesearchaeota archaeon]|nr:RNA-processing protein [Candidatus Woesearchaeota archaeon]
MESLRTELKIPRERIAVLIGKEGAIKREIEESTKTRLDIDSKEGDVFISGPDGLGIYTAKEIVTAIGRGFNPEIAMLLLKVDYSFENLNLQEYMGKSKEGMLRVKGRVIGSEGKTRKHIEEMTETSISVFGKTISIIGETQNVIVARRAVEMLIAGSTHSSVYKWLERKRRELKRREMTERWQS